MLKFSGFGLSPRRFLPPSRDGGGAWTDTACGGWHRGHHLLPGCSRPLQYNGCLLCQQAAPEEAQEEKRSGEDSVFFPQFLSHKIPKYYIILRHFSAYRLRLISASLVKLIK